MTRHPATEQRRLDALDRYNVLDTPPEEAFDRLTRLAALFYDVPVALVSLVDANRQWFKSRVGLSVKETPRGISFCTHAIERDTLLIVNNAAAHPVFRDNPLVTGPPFIRFYAGAPLIDDEGLKLGTLCIIDREPRPDFCPADLEALRSLADIAVSELQLRKSKQNAEQADQAKTNFLSSMSHELRTPLSAILGFSELLQTDRDDPPSACQSEFIEKIHSSGVHLLNLINDLLDLSSIEAGMTSISPENLQPDTIIEESLDTMKPMASKNDISLEYYRGEQELPPVRADGTRFRQVLLNILSNAIKYNRPGGKVMVAVETAPHDRLRILISDTGHGIPGNRQNEIFQRFNRLGAENSNIEGTGLGLALASQLMELMGGAMRLDSVEGKGTEVRLDIPLADSRNSASEPAGRERGVSAGRLSQPSNVATASRAPESR